jgi:hypothetical protein
MVAAGFPAAAGSFFRHSTVPSRSTTAAQSLVPPKSMAMTESMIVAAFYRGESFTTHTSSGAIRSRMVMPSASTAVGTAF